MREGWKLKRLADVCEVVNGGTPKTGVREYWDGDHLWITPAEMGRRSSPYVEETSRRLTDMGLRESSAQLLPSNSVILSSRAPIGHLVINTKPMATNQGCKGLVPSASIDTTFLYYYLSSKVELLNELGTGATFRELSAGKLKEVPIPIPPLPEQRRIVAILDEAFAGIATARANAERNLRNARELFEGYLNEVFTRRQEGWEANQLDALTQSDSPITYGVVKPGEEGEVRFVRGGDLVRGKVRIRDLRTISKAVSDQYRRTLLKGGELLICLVGQPGQVAVAPPELAGANIARQVGLIRLLDKVDAEFVRYFLQSRVGQQALGARQSGSVQQVINLGELRQLEVFYPQIGVQRKVVEQVKLIEGETNRLASIYQRKLAALDELKKSLLHQAFTGELTARHVEEMAA